MKGNAKLIGALNDVLTAELTAINQYFVGRRPKHAAARQGEEYRYRVCRPRAGIRWTIGRSLFAGRMM